jgi:hypothetical protein
VIVSLDSLRVALYIRIRDEEMKTTTEKKMTAKAIIKELRYHGHAIEVRDGKIMAEIWEEKNGKIDCEWVEIKSVEQYNAIYK